MFIEGCNYFYNVDGASPFTSAYAHPQKISHVAQVDDGTIFASDNEIFRLSKNGAKKIGSTYSEVTTLATSSSTADDSPNSSQTGDRNGLIYAGCRNGSIRVFGKFRKCVREYEQQTTSIISIFPLDENNIVAASDDSRIFFYKIENEAAHDRMTIYDGQVNAVGAIGEYLLVSISVFKENEASLETNEIRIYSLEGKEEIHRLKVESRVGSFIVVGNRAYFSTLNKLNRIELGFIGDSNKDPTAGNKNSNVELTQILLHTKIIMSLHLSRNILYSASRDGHIKSTTLGLQPIGGVNVQRNIDGFSIYENRPVVVANRNEILQIKKKAKEETKDVDRWVKRKAYEDDIAYSIVEPAKKRLDVVEHLLNCYSYKKALQKAFTTKSVSQIYKVLEFAHVKRVLWQIFQDCDDEMLENTLCFSVEYFHVKEFQAFILEALELLVRDYEDRITHHKHFHELIVMAADKIDRELEYQGVLLTSISFLESFS